MSTWKSKIAGIWQGRQKVADWRLPFAMFACALLAYGAAFAWHMIANFDLVNILRSVNYDDAYYYFQIAYNLSQGKFSTFDGGITQTNGYQPVWLLLITPFYWLFDKETALYGIKALEIMLVAGGVAVIALAAWLSRLAWPLLFAALPMLYRNPIELLWGMEAAAALFALALLILAVCLYMREPERWKWHVAAIAFALPWVRIEYIAISLAATAVLCAVEWSRQERRSLRPSELAAVRHTYIPLMGAIAGILVYFAYNGLVFGGMLPVSAATKLALSQAQWIREGGYSFLENFRYMIRHDIFDYELRFALEICAYLLIAWRLALRSDDRRDWLLVAFLIGMFGLAAGHLAKFAQTVLTLHPHAGGSREWYFVPAYLMTALIIPVRLYLIILLIRRFIAPRRRIAANALSAGVVVIGAALLLGRAGFAEPFKWVDQESRSTALHWDIASYMGVQVMNRALPEGSVIGSWDAGAIGYFSRFPVVNLDGLVNSYEYFNIAWQSGLVLGKYASLKYAALVDPQMMEITRRYGVTHFANNLDNQQLDRINGLFESIPYDPPYYERRFTLWTYDPAPDTPVEIDHFQQVWDSLKPRFDYSSDGVGVVLAGRAAQAFVRDCPQDEPLIWTWTEPKHERTVSLETVPYRSRANMCVDARVLPRGAARPAQAAMRTAPAYADVDFEDITGSEPIIRSDFDVYLIDGNLIYAKTECSQDDAQARFFANIFPVDADDLIEKSDRRSYDIITFNFHDYGAIHDDGRCLAAIALPNYPIAKIQAGQYESAADGYSHIWDGSYDETVHRAAVQPDFGMLAGSEPIIRSTFDVYQIDDRLIYAKTDCAAADVEARFFASAFPVDPNDLPDRHRRRGYYARDFNFHDYGAIYDGRCWAALDLPNYPISEIHAGQYEESADGYSHIWVGTHDESSDRAAVQPDFESLSAREPIIRSDFDVYIIGDRLIYAKTECNQEDTMARFYASVFPLYAQSLSGGEYDLIEFDFGDNGAIDAAGRCWAETSLPNYPISEIHAGQYVATADGYDYLWEDAYRFE